MNIYVILRKLLHFLNLSFLVNKSAVTVPTIKDCGENENVTTHGKQAEAMPDT